MKTSPQSARDYSKGQVRSADGTTIGYRQRGRGPALILVHGGMQASQHFTRLAATLSAHFTVYVPDRRGRGLSGPHGDHFSVLREVDDLRALVAATGASRIFGLSSGALITLRAAPAIPALDRVALYEPPLSVGGSVPMDWVPRLHREIAAGKIVSALVTVLKGLGTEPVFDRVPRSLLVPLMAAGSRLRRDVPEDEVPIEALVPTQRFDMQIIREMADTVQDYAALDARVLLLDGAKSPAYFRVALDALSAVLPHARRVSFPGLGHSGPDDDGDPQRVGAALGDFFGAQ
ncbi:alpha/beta fold hydrolase [Sphaerisporangium sp. NPDC005289]|uniref:alpha/beta fold hydrolase n=1 Tax=Sphaerisporangium sp. NPDC005289 TaxID=3155247 RepID=UPI0033A41F73